MLNGMTRNAAGEQEVVLVGAEESDGDKDEARNEGESKEDEDKKKKARKIKFTENQGEKTVDKLSNLNVDSFDTTHEIDPLFDKTT